MQQGKGDERTTMNRFLKLTLGANDLSTEAFSVKALSAGTSEETFEVAITHDDLAQVVARSLGEKAVLLGEWNVQPLAYTVRNSVSAGLYRLQGVTAEPEGAARTQNHMDTKSASEVLPWSLILKVVQPQETAASGDPAHWNYWKRELLAYQSGRLEQLVREPLFRQAKETGLEKETGKEEPGLAVPQCWKVEEKADGRVWLWLEDVTESGSRCWTLERYGLAARHFGRFQSRFLQGQSLLHGQPLPADPWISRGWMRTRVASFAGSMQQLHDPAVWDKPVVQRTCPRSLEGRLSQLWAERGDFLDALDRLPQTVCHLDLWRPNLLSRTGPAGEQTVALDWSYIGIGALGQDIGNLVPDTLGNFDIDLDQAAALDHTVFQGYLTGLHERGWTGDTRQARLGYAASAALGWGLGTPWWLVWPKDAARQAQLERQWGRPLEELLARRASLTEFVLDLAQEARTLLAQGTI